MRTVGWSSEKKNLIQVAVSKQTKKKEAPIKFQAKVNFLFVIYYF